MARMAPEKGSQTPRPHFRLIVKARPQLPKRYIWEVVHDDGNGGVITNRMSPDSYMTMEAAYEKGRPALAEIRARYMGKPGSPDDP